MDERRMTDTLPDSLIGVMRDLGGDISAARKVRKLTQADLAERLCVSRKVVVNMEQGNPRISFGTYAAAAWVMGLEKNLSLIFSPENDVLFQREARLDLPQRIRKEAEETMGDLDF